MLAKPLFILELLFSLLVFLFLHFTYHRFDTTILQNTHHIIVHRFCLGSGAGGFVDDFAGSKIDADSIPAFYKGMDPFAGDGGYAQVDGVAIENAAKGFCQYGADLDAFQGPGRMLAGGTAAAISSGHDRVARLV